MSQTRILIVDDNEMSRRLIALPLEEDGHSIMFASSGREALSLLETNKVDLIFLDLLMDDISGLEVLIGVKENPDLKDIPVVVISSIDDPESVSECLTAGALDYLFKPAPAARLREIVSRLSKDESLEVVLLDIKGTAVLDPKAIEQLQADYDDTVTVGFIRNFLNSSTMYERAIAEACNNNDLAEAQRNAVSIKGGARTLGLDRLATVCHNIELQCGSGKSEQTQLRQLTSCLEAAQAALTDFVRARRIED